MSLNHSPAIVTDGLVLCLDAANVRSYPKSGTTWSDLIGANDGALQNMPSNFSNTNGGSLIFDGANEYVDMGDPIVNLDEDFTLSAIVKTPSTLSNNSEYSVIIGKGDVDNVYSGRWAALGYDFQGDSFIFGIDDRVTKSEFFSSKVLSPNTIYSVSMVSDRTNTCYLFIDGKLDGSVTDNTSLDADSNASLFLGTRARSGNNTYYAMAGNIFAAYVYNRALSADEVRRNYEATVGRYT